MMPLSDISSSIVLTENNNTPSLPPPPTSKLSANMLIPQSQSQPASSNNSSSLPSSDRLSSSTSTSSSPRPSISMSISSNGENNPPLLSSIPSILLTTTQQLDQIWSLVGYSSAERNSQVSALMTTIKDMCDMKVQEEMAVAEQFKHSISSTRTEIISTSRALHRSVPQAAMDVYDGLDNNNQTTPSSSSSSSSSASQTLTETLSMLTEISDALRSDASGARQRLAAATNTILTLHAALNTSVPEQFVISDANEEDLQDSVVQAFESEKTQLEEIVATRIGVVVGLVFDCKELLQELQISTDTSIFDRKIVGSLAPKNSNGGNQKVDSSENFDLVSMASTETCVGISGSSLEELTSRVGELNAEKRRRKLKLGELGAEIAALWEKLHISDEVQKAFTESVQGLGMDTLLKGEIEVGRLHALKGEMIGKLINESRELIVSLWDDTNASEAVREGFKGMLVSKERDYTDELLQEHDEEVAVLQARLDQMRPILKMIERREDVNAERMTYEGLQKDPERLKQRGGALTKQLMLEEKMQKRIKDLPKYTDALQKKLAEWKGECGEDFMWRGATYVEVMDTQESEWVEYKNNEAQAKLAKKQEEKARYSGIGGAPSLPGQKKVGAGSRGSKVPLGTHN